MRSVKKRHMRSVCVWLCICLCALPLLEACLLYTSAAILWLCREEAAFVTGQVIGVGVGFGE